LQEYIMSKPGDNPYLAFTHTIEGTGDRSVAREAHKEYRRELESKGVLVAGGPIMDEATSKTSGSGMAIIRATSSAIAADFIRQDPFIKQGFRRFEIKAWRVQNGKL